MLKLRFVVAVLLCISATPLVHAQATSTASRLADLQIGVDFSFGNPDYTANIYNLAQPTTSQFNWKGYGAYVDLDIRYHFGVEASFRTMSGSDPVLYERTYQIGPRFIFPVKVRFAPYAKVLVGRGIFNFAAQDASGKSYEIANLGYNTQAIGGGLDLRLLPGLNIRVIDYEYQKWDNFPPNKLQPQVFSFGVAYHFHGPLAR